jgi:uncharacterized protein
MINFYSFKHVFLFSIFLTSLFVISSPLRASKKISSDSDYQERKKPSKQSISVGSQLQKEGDVESEMMERKSFPLLAISIDGGGIRGVLPATFLRYVEDELEKRLNSRVNLAECVDIFAGTSTGGLITVGLNAPNKEGTSPHYDARTIADFYIEKGDELFPHGGYFYWTYQNVSSAFTPKYNRRVLERLLDENFSSLKRPLNESFSSLIIPSYNANIGKLVFFTENDRHKYTLRDAGLATSAAPYYFAAYKAEDGTVFLDGGLIANNPALNIFRNSQVTEALKGNRPVYLLSLGTGHQQRTKSYEGLETLGGLGLIRNVENFLSLIMQGTSQNSNEILETLRHDFSGIFHSISIDPDIPNDSMDNATTGNISALKNVAIESFNEYLKKKDFQDFLDKISEFSQKGGLLEKRLKRHKEKDVVSFLDLSRIPSPYLSDKTFENVTKLTLSDTVRGAESATKLLESMKDKFPNLEVFDFSRNQLGYGLLNSQFANNMIISKGLKILLLHSNQIKDEHMENMSQTLKELKLNFLDLSHNVLSSEGVNGLLKGLPSRVPFLLNVVNEGENRIKRKSILIQDEQIILSKASTRENLKEVLSQNPDKKIVLH